jgi:hypothetical protein
MFKRTICLLPQFGAAVFVCLMCLLVSAVAASAQTLPSVRVVTKMAQVLARPAAGADVVMTPVQGTVLDVMDNDAGWYWVLLPPDRSETRRRGWIQARDVEAVATDLSAVVRELTEKVDRLQEQLQAKQSTTSTPTEASSAPTQSRVCEIAAFAPTSGRTRTARRRRSVV